MCPVFADLDRAACVKRKAGVQAMVWSSTPIVGQYKTAGTTKLTPGTTLGNLKIVPFKMRDAQLVLRYTLATLGFRVTCAVSEHTCGEIW